MVVVCFVKVVELVFDSVVVIKGLFVANVVLGVEIGDFFVAGVVPVRGPQGHRLVPVATCLMHFFFLAEARRTDMIKTISEVFVTSLV